MTGRDLPKWAPPDSTYSRSGVCLIALGENKGESHEQKKQKEELSLWSEKRKKKKDEEEKKRKQDSHKLSR